VREVHLVHHGGQQVGEEAQARRLPQPAHLPEREREGGRKRE
jgi:hypothetical protein